jgi:hypothetical protein
MLAIELAIVDEMTTCYSHELAILLSLRLLTTCTKVRLAHRHRIVPVVANLAFRVKPSSPFAVKCRSIPPYPGNLAFDSLLLLTRR